MIYPAFSTIKTPRFIFLPIQKPILHPALLHRFRPVLCSDRRNPNTIDKPRTPSKIHLLKPTNVDVVAYQCKDRKCPGSGSGSGHPRVGVQPMLTLCGFGYWVQGFRCFPWLALNFHMARGLGLCPSTLQLVQNSGNLPMVAKPFYGALSDTFYIGGAHRIPYISVGVLLQVLSWGLLALIPVAGEAIPTLMACILFSNLGTSITEVANDALTAEYGQKHRISGLQSYAFMALAAGGILGNLLGGFFLHKTKPMNMFFMFTGLLCLQLAISLTTREDSLGLLPQTRSQNTVRKSVLDNFRVQFSNLMVAMGDKSVSRPLIWISASIVVVPILSGSIFCYQMQCLNLDPSIIGMSRVIGQLILLSTTVLYDRFWKSIPMRKLIVILQILYASSLLLDLVLVKQINLKVGISNEVFAFWFSSIAETIAQFKILPFLVLIGNLSPSGCEGTLTSFLASTLCLSSTVSGFWGIALGNLIGITSNNYSSLQLGILLQFVAALLPLALISHIPMSQVSLSLAENERKRSRSKRARKKRRVGRLVVDSVYAYRREREYDSLR